MTKNTNNYLLKKSIDVREPDKIVYVNLFRVVMSEFFPDDDTRRENFRVIMRRNIATIYRESYHYRII